ncbi:MAG: PAS domain S-box protein [Vampirovibrio sp.]|nr:PAS domain S-box protein [Vampirovibrio sp.]
MSQRLEKYEALYHNAPFLSVSLSPEDGQVLDCNQTLVNRLGYTRDEILAMKVFDLYHPDCHEAVHDAFQAFVTEGEVVNARLELKTKAGEKIHVSLNVKAIYDDAGDILYSNSIWTDISDLVQAEEEVLALNSKLSQQVQDSNIRYRTIFRTAVDSIITIDDTGIIESANPAAEALTGYTQQELLGQNVNLIMPSPYHEEHDEYLANYLKTREKKIIGIGREVAVKTKGGKIIPVELTVSEINFGTRKLFTGILRDITERKRYEEELKDSSTKFQAIFNQTYQFIGILDLDGILLEANSSAMNASGTKPEDVINKPFWETPWWSHSSDLQTQLKEAIEKARAGEFVKFEATHPTPDGSLVHVDFSLKPGYNDAGEIVYLIPEGRDITDIKQVEQALKESEERFRVAVAGSNNGLWDWNILTNEVYYSPRFLELLGYKDESEFPHEFHSFKSHLHPDDHDSTLKAVENHLTHGFPYEIEYRLRVKQGHYRWFLAKGKAIYDNAGKPIRMAGSISDITEKKQLAEALAKQTEEYQFILNTLPATIFYKDDKNTILKLNQRAADTIGYPIEEIEGQPTERFFPEVAEAYLKDDLEVVQSREAKIGYIEPYLPIDGTKCWIRTDKVPYYGGKESPLGVVVISFDVTPEMELREKLLESNQELENFAYIASHDLQEPLRKIQTYCELLENKCQDTLNEDGRRYIQRMVSASGRMRQLIIDLLNYCRINKSDAPLCNVDTKILFGNILSDLEPRLEETKGTIDLSNLPDTLYGSETQLHQLFHNLISNALKFRRDEIPPAVKVAASDPADGFIQISVEDNGIGFDPEYQERIFEVFRRLHDRQIYDGTGIGLSICKKVAERHGGSIQAKSTSEKGSTFTVKLPVSQNPAEVH